MKEITSVSNSIIFWLVHYHYYFLVKAGCKRIEGFDEASHFATFKQIPPSSHVSDGKTNMPPYLRWSHPLLAEGSCDTATDTSYPDH